MICNYMDQLPRCQHQDSPSPASSVAADPGALVARQTRHKRLHLEVGNLGYFSSDLEAAPSSSCGLASPSLASVLGVLVVAMVSSVLPVKL